MKQRHTLRNPVDDSVVTENLHVAGSEDVERAVKAASDAFYGSWRTFSGPQRAKCMLKFADLSEQHAGRLARIESLATGRPVAGVQFFDIAHMVEIFRCTALQTPGFL